MVYVPMTIFFVIYFTGHTLSRRTFWFDRICVHQENLELKAKTIDALPHFVAKSRQMLVLLDETYLERHCRAPLGFAVHWFASVKQINPKS